MITYHYTSFSNWKKIRKQGLVPYEIRHAELFIIFGEYPLGVWLWKNKPRGVAHTGGVLYQLATKNETKIVLLRVSIDESGILLSPDGRNIKMTHDGHIDAFQYHKHERSVIYTDFIPPEDIELVDIYDVKERLK